MRFHLFPLLLLFLVLNVSFRPYGGVNPQSRYATLAALAERGTFWIDGYEDMTLDWARGPDGHYYSNKAPGPVLLSFPVFYLLDAGSNREDRKARNESVLFVLSFLFQVLFAAGAVCYLNAILFGHGVSRQARLFATIAVLFGTTPSLLMNTFFGHALSATLLLVSVLLWTQRRLAWAVGLFGWSLLSDYGTLAVVPAFLLLLFSDVKKTNAEKFQAMVLGAVLPASLWIWYHSSAFGSPIALPHKFQNPLFIDVPGTVSHLWGVLRVIPDFTVLLNLLFGQCRGLLFTQPWVLVVAGLCAWNSAGGRRFPLSGFFLFSLAGLLGMNAAFGGWEGGSTIGPRYLSPILLVAGFVAGLVFDLCPRWVKVLLWVTLGVSVVFYALVLPIDVLAGTGPVWDFFLARLTPWQVVRWAGVVGAIGTAMVASLGRGSAACNVGKA